jgi:HSP20 family protein
MSLWLRTYRSEKDFENFFRSVNALAREFERGFSSATPRGVRRGTWPLTNLVDQGASFMVSAALPGLGVEDIELTVTAEGLTLKGERALVAPEGYSVHRQERGAASFSRTLSFPSKVDPDEVEAVLKDGVLHVTVAKAVEQRARQIQVKVS